MIVFKNKNRKDNNTTYNDKDSGNVLHVVIKEQLFLNVMLNKIKAYVYNTFHC